MHTVKVSSSDCLSELEIDAWRAGELAPADAQRCAEHVAQCAACRDKQLAVEQADAAFYSAAPSFDALRTLVASERQDASVLSPLSGVRAKVHVFPRNRMRAIGAPLAAVAIAALGFLALRSGIEPSAVGETGTRAKGGEPRLGFYVKHGEDVRRGESGERVQPADALRFVYTIDQPYFFALFSRDARELGVYFPAGEHAVELKPGQDAALDFSVELDATPGTEHVIALFCPDTFELEVARAALVSDQELPSAFAACHRVTLELQKQPP